MAIFEKLLIIGCGNMGGAMLAGWLAAGEDPTRFAILDPALDSAPDGVEMFRDAAEPAGHDCVLLGFKPQQLNALAPAFQAITGAGVTVFSLLAGIELEMLAETFPDADAHVRVMPNLAARIGKSPIILAQSGLDAPSRNAALAFYDLLGSAFWLEDERIFDLATALAGSGPGFVYRFIDALASSAAQLGLPAEMAGQLSLQMVEGATALAAESDVPPGELADRVASPGGMTREGLNVLDEGKALEKLLISTLKATAGRGAELGQAIRPKG